MEDIALCGMSACLVIIADEDGKNRKHKRWWCRDLFEEGPRFAVGLLDKLRLNDATGFTNFTRLTPTDFEELFLMVEDEIMKQDAKFRQTIRTSWETLLTEGDFASYTVADVVHTNKTVTILYTVAVCLTL